MDLPPSQPTLSLEKLILSQFWRNVAFTPNHFYKHTRAGICQESCLEQQVGRRYRIPPSFQFVNAGTIKNIYTTYRCFFSAEFAQMYSSHMATLG